MKNPLTTALFKVASAYPAPVPASQLSSNQKQAILSFSQRTGAIQSQKKGRGTIYVVVDKQILDTYLNQLSPGSDNLHVLPPRAKSLALNRSTKTGKSTHEKAYLLIKTNGSPEWFINGKPTQVIEEAVNILGACSIEVGGDSNKNLTTNSTIWLVENQELFEKLDWLPSNEPTTVIWYRGHISRHLLDWLSSASRTPNVLLFSDYDGVGLVNYYRAWKKLNDQIQFWLMPDWRRLLSTYGSEMVWKSTLSDFETFESKAGRLLEANSELATLIEKMKIQGLALEQEAVWLAKKDL